MMDRFVMRKEIEKKILDGTRLTDEEEKFRKKFLEDQETPIAEFEAKQKLLLEYLSFIHQRDPNWASASEILEKHILSKMHIYTTKEDIKSEVWVYQDGIYVPQGRSAIKVILREVLEKHYSAYVFNLVMNKIEPDTFIASDKFFSICYPYETVVENGILNIKTKELKPFTPEKIFFNKLPVKYDQEAKCPKISQFLSEVLLKEDDIKLIYEIGGFGLIKIYLFAKAFMFLGNGRNGKDKTFELLRRLFGIENCCTVPLSSLVEESFNISELFGKLLNLAGDIDNRDLKDTGTFKSATGRTLLGGHRKFLNNIHFENYAKFVFACNDLPMVYDTSKGFWDRWVLLEFPYTFIPKEEYDKAEDKTMLKIRDEEIIQKIVTPGEMSGFLNECLEGLHRLLKNRQFSTTTGSEEVKAKWIRKSNSFMAFCMDNIEQNYEGKISKKEIRQKYSFYCKEHKTTGKSDLVIKIVLQELFGAIEERIQVFGQIQEWFWVGVKWK